MLRRVLLSAVAIAAVSPAFAAQYRINRCASIQGNDTWMLAFDQQNNKVNFWREDEDHGVHFGLYTVETNGDVTMDVGNKPAVHITMHPSGFTAWQSGDSKGTMNCVYADDTDIQPVRWYDPSPPVAAPEPAPTLADAPAAPAPTYNAPAPDHVPIIINGTEALVALSVGSLPLIALIDTGATSMSVPLSTANALIANGQAVEGPAITITHADGRAVPGRSIIISVVTIGDHVLHDIRSSVEPDGSETLLGFRVLNMVSGKFAINTNTNTLDFE